MFEDLLKLSHHFLKIKYEPYHRSFLKMRSLSHRLTVLTGQRGVGKTTMLIQYLLKQADSDVLSPKILYVQADHFLMAGISLYEIADTFQAMGGEHLAIDEIHKYLNWSLELKSIYDTFPKLKVIASGSSALEIHKGTHDLSRRAIVYSVPGLSFREYLDLKLGTSFSPITLEKILNDHARLAKNIMDKLGEINAKVLPCFHEYLQWGYYPYFRETKEKAIYYMLLEQNIHTTLESDLISIYPQLTGNSIRKIKQVLGYISSAVPFIPNWQKLKSIVDVADIRTLKTYFKYLEDAGLIRQVGKQGAKLNKLEVGEKIYLNNPNQFCAISSDDHNRGTLRETFFVSMLQAEHAIKLPGQGDFQCNKYVFEIGGRNKNYDQIKGQPDSYLALDGLEAGIGNKIPLWIFGFIY